VNERRAGAARAALALAALLGARALARDAVPVPCADPAESAARGGHTHEVACGAASGRPLRGPALLLFGAAIDPNRADRATLEAVPGIGPARAEAIVRERTRAPFCNAADLQRVVGIGPKTAAMALRWMAFDASNGCGNRH